MKSIVTVLVRLNQIARAPTEYLITALSFLTRRIGRTVRARRTTRHVEPKISAASRIDGSVTKRVCQVK